MAQTEDPRVPVIVKAFREFSPKIREVAAGMNIPYTEGSVPGRTDLVMFTFDIDFAAAQPFLSALPTEAFANRGIVTFDA